MHVLKLLPGRDKSLRVEVGVRFQKERRNRTANLVLHGESPHIQDPIEKLVVLDVRPDELALDQLEQFLQCPPRGFSQRVFVDDRENALEALPNVALRRVFCDVRRQLLKNRAKDELTNSPDSEPFDHASFLGTRISVSEYLCTSICVRIATMPLRESRSAASSASPAAMNARHVGRWFRSIGPDIIRGFVQRSGADVGTFPTHTG